MAQNPYRNNPISFPAEIRMPITEFREQLAVAWDRGYAQQCFESYQQGFKDGAVAEHERAINMQELKPIPLADAISPEYDAQFPKRIKQ